MSALSPVQLAATPSPPAVLICSHSLILLNAFFTVLYVLHKGQEEVGKQKGFPSYLYTQAKYTDLMFPLCRRNVRKV